jgi:hypothetical protein
VVRVPLTILRIKKKTHRPFAYTDSEKGEEAENMTTENTVQLVGSVERSGQRTPNESLVGGTSVVSKAVK